MKAPQFRSGGILIAKDLNPWHNAEFRQELMQNNDKV